MRGSFAGLITLLLIFSLAGCAPGETTVTGDEMQAVLEFSETKTDSLLAGMNANDYTLFAADFDQEMATAMTAEEFVKLKLDRDAKLGLYVSRQVNRVVKQGDFYIVIYDTVFEKDDDVLMRVVFRTAEPHQVSGLWFNK